MGIHASSPKTAVPELSAEILPSLYQQRIRQLIDDAVDRPPVEPLEATIRGCIAFCYDVTREWAPHVRVIVFADNTSEHQLNVPVYETLLCNWGEPSFAAAKVTCKPIPGTDVQRGQVLPSTFWTRSVGSNGRKLPFRSLAHWFLNWFLQLNDTDSRKQLLVNMLLQLHEACFNCVGRHKEVFEYCIYDLMQAEAQLPVEPTVAAKHAVQRHAMRFLDQCKRNALHAALISPQKFLFQNCYEVFENLDSHGSSFWVAVLEVFYPGLEMPFESIVDLDTGWGWGATDFLPFMQSGHAKLAWERFMDVDNLGRDWRSLTVDLCQPSDAFMPQSFRSLPFLRNPVGFRRALESAGSGRLRQQLQPYVGHFASLLAQKHLIRQWALAAVGSERWDAELGPALSEISGLAPSEVRSKLVDVESLPVKVDLDAAGELLRAAGVAWARSE